MAPHNAICAGVRARNKKARETNAPRPRNKRRTSEKGLNPHRETTRPSSRISHWRRLTRSSSRVCFARWADRRTRCWWTAVSRRLTAGEDGVGAGVGGGEGVGDEVEEICSPDSIPGCAGQLTGQQIAQPGEVAAGGLSCLGIGQGGEGVDQEDFAHGIALVEHAAPVGADVLFDVGVGLDEDQAGTGGQRRPVRRPRVRCGISAAW